MDRKNKILISIGYASLWSLLMIYVINTVFSLAEQYGENVLILFLPAVAAILVFGFVGYIYLMKSLDDLGKKQE